MKTTKPKPFFKTSVNAAMKDPISIDALQTALLLVSVDVSRMVLCRWTVRQRALAEDWAIRLHFNASDNHYVRVPQKPPFVTRAQKQHPGRPGDRSLRCEAVLHKQATGTLHELFPSPPSRLRGTKSSHATR